ncbi:MAG: HAMP domain-containing histidine kinase [Deltaproteobacteria bacterium]|nr:HAMP domain-containing histidine kinase [Deltaproteobacteria bacterium]MBW1962458.1 HAMP domain-containing histidine kinase [Deltaproteobacteria bacterium]MBW1994775.1 HAMP domain-containing histidine kinase [Deltaproteobacteria bacterium]MBW2154140.1 HAMP domain-containing histidine kinase [Deltaproteobacteria bacterium]
MEERLNQKEHTPFLRELQIEYLIHELKSPLSVIETGLRLLLDKRDNYGALSPVQEKTLLRALRNARKVRHILNDLLEIGRSEAGCFETCRFRPLEAMFEALYEAMETIPAAADEPLAGRKIGYEQLNGYGIYLNISDAVESIEMFQDEKKFRRIFGNLVRNALYHRRERVDIKVDRKEDRLVIDVTDDGPGVKPEHQKTIFSRYKQVDAKSKLNRPGHGLGLAGSLTLARLLGGNIELMSGKIKGATFRLMLPINREFPLKSRP